MSGSHTTRVALRPSLALAAALIAACAPETAPAGRAAQPIAGGAEGGPEAVIGLLADGELFCSATLISGRVALTAAHCILLIDPAAEVEAFFGDRVDGDGTRVLIGARLAHPDWSPDAQPDDIGLLALTEDAPVPPLAPSRHPLGENDVGETVELVGLGDASARGDGAGVRRSARAPIAAVEDKVIAVAPGPPATCPGDSGGAVLGAGDDGQAVIAVHSRSDCQALSLAERVDVHLEDFIDPFLAEHPDGCGAEPCDDAGEDDAGGGDGGGCAAGGGGGPPAALLALLALSAARRGCARPARRAGRAAPAGGRRRR